ncbi:hypothetical protein E2C01_029118 [Portunus trituberculatus]|uniref:Uncharacterized protein n=1 Tax=Portunus trituberculatus TaxID=210409 RepID=A0A5B7ERE3_PORTR|nr:hypothetical protein [Portunus trituberculatus]
MQAPTQLPKRGHDQPWGHVVSAVSPGRQGRRATDVDVIFQTNLFCFFCSASHSSSFTPTHVSQRT